MIKTPLSTVIGGAFWTPGATILGGTSKSKTFNQIIKSLFDNGEQGFFYDPNDLATMFQDAAGTVPVTGAGQPVGLILDKSGRNNHARQTTSASRPLLQRNATTGAYYLEFDGIDDFLQTNNIDFTATDKVSLFGSVRALSSALGMICELGIGQRNNFYLTNEYFFYTSGASIYLHGIASQYPQQSYPDSAVLTGKGDLSANLNRIRKNAVFGTDNTETFLGGGKYSNYPLYIGTRGGVWLSFNGHIYSLIGVGRLTTYAETAALEKLIAKNTGVTLSV